MNKKIIRRLVTVIMAIAVITMFLLIRPITATIDDLAIEKVYQPDDGLISISGAILDSSSKFNNYTWEQDGDTLYIKIKKSFLVKRGNDSSFYIEDLIPEDVKSIYIQGKDKKDVYLIWSEESKDDKNKINP